MINEDYLANIRPTHRQLQWQRMEMYAFIHFGMNTMTDREWGEGHEDPALFNPGNVDVDQWMGALVSAGMTGVILTCKHHDGFCLWPSAYTKHSVESSPWKGGRGDLVREVSEAAARHGLKFGVYLSPWDMTEPTYGQGDAYNDFYINQLIELLTHYGPVFSVWLDGACGEGPNGKVQVYDWQRIYDTVRALAPEAVISVCGPDVRWCGNEAGSVRANEWSVVPASLREAERTAEKSQKADDGEFSRQVASGDEDLGSRKALADYAGPLAWYPAEVNTSTRKGWFHHDIEDSQVRSVEELFSIWKGSVGGNATFLLNVPPNRDGLLADADVEVLARLGEKIADFHSRRIEASREDEGDAVTLCFDEPHAVGAIVLEEDIAQGQRIDEAVVTACLSGDGEQEIARVQCVGYRRIITLEKPVTATQVRVTVTKSRQGFYLADFFAIGA